MEPTKKNQTTKLLTLLSAVVLLLSAIVATGSAAVAQESMDDPAQLAAGEAVYAASCAGCHSDDGTGVAGVGRPLTGIAMQEADRTVHIASVNDGKGNMPGFGERLSADEVDAVVSYVRLTFVDEAATTSMNDSEELAETGTSTTMPLLVIAGTALTAGALLTHRSRRQLLG